MTNKKIDTKQFFNLLSRFSDKSFDIAEDLVDTAAAYVFNNVYHPELDHHPELMRTLAYLKNVRERNQLKELNDLIQYYEAKRKRVTVLFKKLVEINQEEVFAVTFQQACSQHFRSVRADQISKEQLYYPMTRENHYAVAFDNISYVDSIEEEIIYLRQVKGNLLMKQQNVACVSSEKNKQLISN